MDLKSLSDVELTQHYLDVVKAVPTPRKALKAVEDEARLRGPERMSSAREALGNEREAARMALVLP